MFLRGTGASVFTRTPTAFTAAMEKPPRVYPQMDPAAQTAALTEAGMFDCPRFPGAVRLSERQCLINQERAAAGGYPSFCLGCDQGAEIKARHPQGAEGAVNSADLYDWGRRLGKTKSGPPKAPSPRPSPPRGEGEKQVDEAGDSPQADLAGQAGDTRFDDMKVVTKLDVARCPNHPEQPQKKDHNGIPIGVCELCLKSAKPNDGRALPAVSLNRGPVEGAQAGTPAPTAPRCRKHPEERQLANAKSKKAKNAARRAGVPPAPPSPLPGGESPPAQPPFEGRGKGEGEKEASPLAPGAETPFCARHQVEKERCRDDRYRCRRCAAESGAMKKGKRKSAAGKNQTTAGTQADDSREYLLLAKLPDFDPAWPDELKLKWLDIFQKIVSPAPEEDPQAGRQAGRQAGTLTLLAGGQ